MTARMINVEELRYLEFPAEDVLQTFEDRFERGHKLRSAMALTHEYHEDIPLTIKLSNGDTVVIKSNMIDFEDDYVEIRGGFGIPVRAIVEVGI